MRRKTKWTILLAVALWVRLGTPGAAFPMDCSRVCSSTANCNDQCYNGVGAFESDTSETCYVYGVYDSSTCPVGGPGNFNSPDGPCGNGQCDANETCDSCPKDCSGALADCGQCGDSYCSQAEAGGSGQSPHCDPVHQSWCHYCPDDCGACDPDECVAEGGAVCDPTYGNCRPCYTNYECPSDYSCDNGTCEIGAWCDPNDPFSCAFGYYCNEDNHCVPEG